MINKFLIFPSKKRIFAEICNTSDCERGKKRNDKDEKKCDSIAVTFFLSIKYSLLHIAYLDKVLCYLDSVEGSALAYLVASEPEGIAVVVGEVLTNTTYINIILTCTLERHWVNVVLRIVLECYARSSLQSLADLLD